MTTTPDAYVVRCLWCGWSARLLRPDSNAAGLANEVLDVALAEHVRLAHVIVKPEP